MTKPLGPFEFDVAISFMGQDEALATKIALELRKTLGVFIYSQQQAQLAGRPGDEAFSEAFGKKARIVLILYRAAWGETPFTRVEKTAIRNRAHDHGYDFCLFVPLERPLPDYVPKPSIWFDIDTFGTAVLPAIVSRMAKEQGAKARTETPIERAQRVAALEQFRERRDIYLDTREAGIACQASFEALRDQFDSLAKAFSEQGAGIALHIQRDPSKSNSMWQVFLVLHHRAGLRVELFREATHTVRTSELRTSVWGGRPPLNESSVYFGDPPPILVSRKFGFDLTPSGPAWTEKGAKAREFDAELLATDLLNSLLEGEERMVRDRGGR